MCLGMNPDKLEGQSGVRAPRRTGTSKGGRESDGTHAADESGDGGGRGDHRRVTDVRELVDKVPAGAR
jgi:hypothetical protein